MALIRFYLDECLPPAVAVLARSFGLDVVSAHEHGRHGIRDDMQLAPAAQDDRCLVTRNARDFMPLTTKFHEAGHSHAGVLLVPVTLENREFSALADALVRCAQEHPEGMVPYMVDYLRRAAAR